MRTQFNPKDRSRQYGRRAALALAGQSFLLTALGARFFQLQVLDSERYQLLADENRLNWLPLVPRRGLILDRNNTTLAENQPRYTLALTAENLAKFDQGIDQIAALGVFDRQAIDDIRSQRENFKANLPVLLRSELNWEQVSRIEYDSDHLSGVAITQTHRRFYPQSQFSAHIIGYTGIPDRHQISENPQFRHPLFEVGKIGVERSADSLLRGSFGSSQVEVNARGRIIRHLSAHAAQPGKNIQLPLDSGLQAFIYNRLLEYRRAAVVVANARNSAIEAMVSLPSYDPNLFYGGIDPKKWQALITNPDFPLENRTIRGRYPPGSTFKLCVAQAALRQGFAPNRTFVCRGKIDFADRTYHCWKAHGHGRLDLIGALRESCDIYFYALSQIVGIDNIAAEAVKLGLGSDSFTDLSEALAGTVPTREWKQQRFSKPWLLGETMITAIGQGYCLTTPLELVTMMLRLLSVDGNNRRPWLWKAPEVIGENGDANLRQEFDQSLEQDQQWQDLLHKSMVQVINHPKGTAYFARMDRKTGGFAGKTGTAQVRTISKREREESLEMDTDSPFHLRDHGLFVGYAPLDKPRFVIATVIEHIGSGAFAAVVSRDVLDWAIRHIDDA